jgi:hypothetical protein
MVEASASCRSQRPLRIGGDHRPLSEEARRLFPLVRRGVLRVALDGHYNSSPA